MNSKHHAVRRACFWATAAALALLSACAAPPIDGNRQLSEGEGAVMLKLVPKGSSPVDPVELLTAMSVQEVLPPGAEQSSAGGTRTAAVPRAYQLNRTKLSTRSTTVFSGLLPPGKYAITSMTGMLYPTTYTFPFHRRLPAFEVKAKTATMLGTVLVQPGAGKSFAVAYVPPDEEFRATFKQLYPALEAQSKDVAPLGFDQSDKQLLETALAQSFRFRVAGLNGLSQGEDGTLYAGTRTGIALMRKTTDQNWRNLDLRSWREVTSVRPYRDGLVASGEEGLLKFSKDGGLTWAPLAAPDQGLIYAVEPAPSGHLMAVSRFRSTWSVYRSADPFAGNWQKLATFEHERSLNVSFTDARVVASGVQIGVMMPNGTYYLIDSEKGSVEKFSGALSVLELWVSPGGRLVQQGIGTLTAKTIVSDNFGRSWTDVNLSRFTTGVVFKDKDTSYAVGPVDPGVTAGSFALMTSRDGGKTWVPTGVVPGGVAGAVGELMIDRIDGSLLAVLKNATVMRSKDEGANWQTQGR
jgi:photosystem II stability/assembly factor-like uncharacterized protein